MLLQRLNQNDLPEIIAFNRRCFSPGDRWSGEDWTELLEDERAHYYALLENGQIVGNMFLYNWQGERDFLKIMNLGVAPDRRGQGDGVPAAAKGGGGAEGFDADALLR